MSFISCINLERIQRLSQLVSEDEEIGRKVIIITEPKPHRYIGDIGKIDFEYDNDTEEWILPDQIKKIIQELIKDDSLSREDKILRIYEEICRMYEYDDYVLAYVRRYDENEYELTDNYGRKTSDDWKANREQHNRRVCFEISRILAKAIEETLGNSSDFDVAILWDKAVVHYFVGIACNEYCVTFDLDNFRKLKDITRVKMGLSLSGVRVLEDENDIFRKALEKINSKRETSFSDMVEKEKRERSVVLETTSIEESDMKYFEFVIELLKEKGLDSQGIFEYMKSIVDKKLGSDSRRKVWKRIKSADGKNSERFTRCLIIKIGDEEYIVDGDGKDIFRKYDKSEEEGASPSYFDSRKFSRNWDENPYNGR